MAKTLITVADTIASVTITISAVAIISSIAATIAKTTNAIVVKVTLSCGIQTLAYMSLDENDGYIENLYLVQLLNFHSLIWNY